MKKIIAIILSIIIARSVLMPVYASSGIDILQAHNEEYSEETNDVRLAVEAGLSEYTSYIGVGPTTIDFDLMYRCYEPINPDLVKVYEENGSLKENIGTAYSWIVPKYAHENGSNINNGGEVTVVESSDIEFGWVIRDGLNYPIYENNLKVDFASVCDIILDEHPEVDIDSICAFNSNNLNCRLFYFSENETEYLLPVFLKEDPEWASSGEIYEAGEFIDKAEVYFPSNPETDDGFFSTLRNNLDYIIVAGVIVLVAVVAAGIYIKRKREGSEEL